jgi:CheY-like chemotaxis protein
MDPATRERIFEPFFTTKGHARGTGMGLATVYGIVTQNGGHILVDSEPGRGATFRCFLPRCLADAVAPVVREPVARTGRETILLLEDEPTLLRVCRRLLEKLGYRVLTAGTPDEALRLALEHPHAIHLLLTDVVMPQMNGRDLARQLVAFQPELRCLFMSGYTTDIISHQGVLDAGVHFLRKPFTQAELAVKVREALEAS